MGYAASRKPQVGKKVMTLLAVSIVLEIAVAVIAILAAVKGRPHLYGLALTSSFMCCTTLAACSAGASKRGFYPRCSW